MADYTITMDIVNLHPKLNQAITSTKNLKNALKSYMDNEIVQNGGTEDASYQVSTDTYMAALDAALVAYEAEATVQDTTDLTLKEANALWAEKVRLDAEITRLEADPNIDDLENNTNYKRLKARQFYLDDAYAQLVAQGFTPPVTPVAEFSAIPLIAAVRSAIQFTDLSSNAPTDWLWTFVGATTPTSTEQNPIVGYLTAGTYDVVLKASNVAGETTETKVGYITVEDVVIP